VSIDVKEAAACAQVEGRSPTLQVIEHDLRTTQTADCTRIIETMSAVTA